MGNIVLTTRSQKVTVPANTEDHTIEFDGIMEDSDAYAAVTMLTGTSVQFNPEGVVNADSMALGSSGNNTKEMFLVKFGVKMGIKGGAGGETFNINIIE